jgi:hypothetical protein
MSNKKNWWTLLPVVIIAIIIHFFTANIILVEKYYSTGIYPYISNTVKYLFGWLPFSFGDILYGAAALWIIFKIYGYIIAIVKGNISGASFLAGIYKTIRLLLLIYIVFNLFWGINYNRIGIAGQLGMEVKKYSTPDLVMIDSLLLLKVNESKKALLDNPKPIASSSQIKEQAIAAYKNIAKKYPFLTYQPSSIKPSMWGWLGNYLGFMGYYNPFTGEAQVNTTVPKFLQPYTFCHETAHQLGYAKENEANFVGYLSASASTDTAFHYSVYLDLFLYAQRNLYRSDSNAVKSFAKQLLPAVKKDLDNWRKFNDQHRNPIEPIIAWMYGNYLKNNQQPSGVQSYDEVLGLLIAYYKKFGSI